MAAGVARWVPSSVYRYTKDLRLSSHGVSAACSKKNESPSPMVAKNKSKTRRITISTSDGRWNGKWDTDYLFSLRDLGLSNELLDEGADRNTRVHVTLSIDKHTGLGLSVEGRIRTSFTTRCCNCCAPFVREIDAPFKVWILASTRQTKDPHQQLPMIGEDDPSVILVKPGCDADLDSVIQDTARLAISVNETCSESCEKAEPRLQYFGTKNTASVHTRWSKLLELKNKGFIPDR